MYLPYECIQGPRTAVGRERTGAPARWCSRSVPAPTDSGDDNVEFHRGLFGEETVVPHFLALIVRERATELRGPRPDFTREAASHGIRILGGQWDE